MADSSISIHLDSYLGSSNASEAADGRLDEECLLAGLREGTEAAYEALIAQYQQPVYGLVYRLLSDPSETCDVVQEVFLKVFRNVGSFRGQSSLKTWIYRIAVNEAYNQRRWFTRHRSQEIGLEQDEERTRNLSDTLSDPGRSPFDVVSDHERRQLIEEALQSLNPTFRTAVVLRDIEELSYEEIAEVLQIHLGTVKSRIVRGREALRKHLTGRLEPAPSLQWTPQPAD
ncbi:MAG: RNA polymerase sigma factor [Bryobacteraceae bacterium]